MVSAFRYKISNVANALVNQALMHNCSIEIAWNDYMYSDITKQIDFNEVKAYIAGKIEKGQDI